MPFFQDQQPSSYTTPQTTPYQQQLQSGVAGQLQQYQQQYKSAQGDPNFAIGDPKMRMLKENELVDDIYNRLGAGAMGGSGKSLASKAIVDYRLGLVDKQQAALQNLRQSMSALFTGAQGQPLHVTDVQGRVNPFNQMLAGAGTLGLAKGFANIGGQGNSSVWDWAKGLWGGGQPTYNGFQPDPSMDAGAWNTGVGGWY